MIFDYDKRLNTYIHKNIFYVRISFVSQLLEMIFFFFFYYNIFYVLNFILIPFNVLRVY